MAAYWQRIEAWLSVNAPEIIPLLPTGVLEASFAPAEAVFGFEIPEQVKASLRVHDGSGDVWICRQGAFPSLKMMQHRWKYGQESWCEGAANRRRFLPVVDAWGTGAQVCVDMGGGRAEGREGQVVDCSPDPEVAGVVYAQSYEEFIDEYVNELEAGKFYLKHNVQGGPYLRCRE